MWMLLRCSRLAAVRSPVPGFGRRLSARAAVESRGPELAPQALMRAGSIQHIIRLHAKHGSTFDSEAVGTMWYVFRRRANLEKHAGGWLRTAELAEAARPMCVQTGRMLRDHELCPRAIASAVHALSALDLTGRGEPWDDVWHSAPPAVLRRLDDFSDQELAKVAVGFCRRAHVPPPLLSALGSQVQARADKFMPSELSALAWGFAHAGHTPADLFQALGGAADACVSRMSAADLAATARAHVASGLAASSSAGLMGRLAAAAVVRIDQFGPKLLADLLTSYARLGQPMPPALLDAAAAATPGCVGAATGADVANLFWGFARVLDRPRPQLVDTLCRAGVRRSQSLDARQMSMVCWAVATLRHRSPDADALLRALATQWAGKGVDRMAAQGLANVAWAYARLDLREEHLFAAIAAEAVGRMGEFGAQGLANLCWAFATAGAHTEPLLHAIEASAVPRLAAFRPEELASLAWSFAHTGHTHPHLFGLLADEVQALPPPLYLSRAEPSCPDPCAATFPQPPGITTPLPFSLPSL